MLGWVIACHDERAQELLNDLEAQFAPLVQCRAVNFHRGLSTNMLSRMMCDALHGKQIRVMALSFLPILPVRHPTGLQPC